MARPLGVAVVAGAVMPLHGDGRRARAVHDLVRHLAARGVDVTLIVPPAVPIQRQSTTDPFASPHIRLQQVRDLAFLLANRRGATVRDHRLAYLFYGWRAGRVAQAAAAAGDVQLIHGFGLGALGAAGGRTTAPLVFTPESLEAFETTGRPFASLKHLGYVPLRWGLGRIARAADAIIATDTALEPAAARHLAPATGQLRTIPDGVDLVQMGALAGPTDGLLTRQRHGITAGEIVFVSAGRLALDAGFDLLPAALSRAAAPASTLAATGWRWVLIGAGPHRAEIERQITRHGLAPHVILTGRTTDRELHAWYEAANAVVAPTRTGGRSLVTLEAMAHRRAVIATATGGLPDHVHPNVTGWLVEPNDVDGLADSLDGAARQPTHLVTMGERGRELVERQFAWSVLVDRYVDLYRELLAAKGR